MMQDKRNCAARRFAGATFCLLACSIPFAGLAIDEKTNDAIKVKSVPAEHPAQAVESLMKRVLPAGYEKQFFLEIIEPAEGGKDVFEIDRAGGQIALRGNNGVSLASAFNWYLKYTCNVSVGWSGVQMNLRAKLPLPMGKTRIVTSYSFRTYLNYCTFNYTMSWWNWERWEREIDLMALNGINAPLHIVGQEAVWLNTFKQFGMTEKQITDEFLVGPTYFAWAWMANIDRVGGPLPMAWIEQRIELANKILARMRSLGMEPILQGFTGHVPGQLVELYPAAKILKSPKAWGGMDPLFQLDPLDPLFIEIGKTFYEEQKKLFGTTRYYAADPFHESAPPIDTPEYLHDVGRTILDVMTRVHPNSTWVMQSWSLREPLVKAVPKDRLLVSDLNGKRALGTEEPFWGYPSAWGDLNNYGGRTFLRGELGAMLARPAIPKHHNIVGLGLFDEATEINPVMFEALYENVWRNKAPEPVQWVADYAARRYGAMNPQLKQAWDILNRTVYNGGRKSNSVIAARPCLSVDRAGPNEHIFLHYEPKDLLMAWEALVDGGAAGIDAPGYGFDLVLVGRQVLANHAMVLYNDWVNAYLHGDRERYEKSKRAFLAVFDDMDRLLSTDEMSLLGKWIADARSWGTTPAESDQYERNAKAFVSLWEVDYVSNFHDYAWRYWGGLVGDYYKTRWSQFLEFIDEQLEQGTGYDDWSNNKRRLSRLRHDAHPFYEKQYQWERRWAADVSKDYPATAQGDTYAVSCELTAKYKSLILDALAAAEKHGYPVDLTERAAAPNAKTRPALGGKDAKVAPAETVRDAGGNLALNCAVDCSEGKRVERVVDGKIDNKSCWSAPKAPAWVSVDLGRVVNVKKVVLYTYAKRGRYYQYTIETSVDGMAWLPLVDARENITETSAKGYVHEVSDSAQFIRVNMLHNNENPAVHISEIEVFGK